MARSRSRARGHVRQRASGQWVFVLNIPRQRVQRCAECRRPHWVERTPEETCTRCDAALGEVQLERRQRWSGGFASSPAANAAMTEALGKLDKGADPFGSSLRFGEYAATWRESAPARIGPRTLTAYVGLLERDLLPHLRDIRLRSLKPAHIREALDAMTARGLAAATVRQAKAVASTILQQAVEDGLMDLNPCRSVRAPKIVREEIKPPDAMALGRLMSAARDTQWEIPMLLSVSTGARRGEVLALEWSDVDLSRREVRISRSLQWISGDDGRRHLRVLGVKTERSDRTISLPAFAVSRLKQHRREQAERYLLLGEGRVREEGLADLICDRGDGRACDPDGFTTGFKKIAQRAGQPSSTRLHDVRHGVASVLAAKGTPVSTVSTVLGHASTVFTSSRYQHAFGSTVKQAADDLDAAIGDGS